MKAKLLFLFISFFTISKSGIAQEMQSQTQKEIDKEFLEIKLELPYGAFKNYKLTQLYHDYGPKEYYFTDNSIPSFKSLKVNSGSFQFSLGKLSSFFLEFDKQPDGSFDTLKNYFSIKYGTPTIINKVFSKIQEQNYEEVNIWETANYKLKLIKLRGYSDGTFNEAKKFHYVQMELTSKRLEKEREEQLTKKNLQIESEETVYKERLGKGNATFVPDINASIKLLLSNSTLTTFEKLLPAYSTGSPDTLYSYNKNTDEYDLFDAIKYTYIFTYKNIQVTAEVETSKNKVLKKIEYHFDNDPLIRFALQRNQNGLVINESMTKIVTKMGMNDCIVYDNNQKIHLTEYTSRHFTVQKY